MPEEDDGAKHAAVDVPKDLHGPQIPERGVKTSASHVSRADGRLAHHEVSTGASEPRDGPQNHGDCTTLWGEVQEDPNSEPGWPPANPRGTRRSVTTGVKARTPPRKRRPPTLFANKKRVYADDLDRALPREEGPVASRRRTGWRDISAAVIVPGAWRSEHN